jgi:NAD+ synthase (glutamine-hydrolysing)
MKILLAQLNYIVGDLKGNTEKILSTLQHARKENVDLVVFSELAICGYPPEDLLLEEGFIEAVDQCLKKIIQASEDLTVIIGMPRENPSGQGKPFHNSAAIVQGGHLLGYYDKSLLPTYDVFDEGRYFEPGTTPLIWECKGKKFAVLICEDIWQHAKQIPYTNYVRDPINELTSNSVDFLVVIAASPYHVKKIDQRIGVCQQVIQTLKCPLFLCSQVGGNDQLIFDGYSLWMDAQGTVQRLAKGFMEDFSICDLDQNLPQVLQLSSRVEEMVAALVLGVRDYFHKNGFFKACLGLSGGVDSAVVACIATLALGKENVLALMMPSRYSSSSSFTDAKLLLERLGIASEEISIEEPFESYLTLLQPYFAGYPSDITEENLQARVRAMLLMAFSNKLGYLVLNTSNKSEMALGFTTLYGDLCGALSPISDLLKTQVYELASFFHEDQRLIPLAILQKEPSPELRPHHKTTDSLPKYDLLDPIIYAYIEERKSAQRIAQEQQLDLTLVLDLIRRIHQAEYKRRQAPPGIRMSQKSFRIGREIPIVQKWRCGL